MNKTDAVVLEWWQNFWGLPENIWVVLGMIASLITLIAIGATFMSIRHQNQRFAFETLSHVIDKVADDKTRNARKILFTNVDRVSKLIGKESPFEEETLEELYESCTHLAMVYTTVSFLLLDNKKFYNQFLILHGNAVSRVYSTMKELVEDWDKKRPGGYQHFQKIGEDAVKLNPPSLK